MEYRRLGVSGLQVSEIGLGTNNFGARLDLEGTRAVIDSALEHGVTFFDTADVYGTGKSEELIGTCLRGEKRQRVTIATKFANPFGGDRDKRGGSRRYVVQAVEASLRRLQTDYIDLYQMHVPDPDTPILETLQALDDLVWQGKIRYYGHSNFAAWQIADAQWTARTEHLARPISAQHEYSLLVREVQHEVLPACRAMGLGLLPFFPLAGGMLTGKYRRGAGLQAGRLGSAPRLAERFASDASYDRVERLEAFASERGRTLLELAFGWLLSQPEVSSVIAGAMTPEQLSQNATAGTWRLTQDEVETVASLL